MKSFILFLSVGLLFSCKQNKKSLLEGAWIRKGTINYKGGKPIDTVEFKGIFFEVYTKGSFSLLMNEIKIDSITGEEENEMLIGGAWDDVLNGGLGFGFLTRGEGSDRFVFIDYDFSSSEDDKINLSENDIIFCNTNYVDLLFKSLKKCKLKNLKLRFLKIKDI